MTDRRPGPEALAGAGIGLLVGLLVGLSTAEVVGGVIGALTALLAAFFGLRTSASEGGEGQVGVAPGDPRVWRLAGFGIMGSLALVVGLWMRASNALGRDPGEMMGEYVDAGFDPTVAQGLVAYQLLGVAPEGWELVRDNAAAGGGTVLFAGDAASECSNLRESRFGGPSAWARALETSADSSWRAVGAAVSGLDPEAQRGVLRAAWSMVCNQ